LQNSGSDDITHKNMQMQKPEAAVAVVLLASLLCEKLSHTTTMMCRTVPAKSSQVKAAKLKAKLI
jgi:hypothetical protein